MNKSNINIDQGNKLVSMLKILARMRGDELTIGNTKKYVALYITSLN